MFALLMAFIWWLTGLFLRALNSVLIPAPIYPLAEARSASQAKLDRHLTRPPLVWAAP